MEIRKYDLLLFILMYPIFIPLCTAVIPLMSYINRLAYIFTFVYSMCLLIKKGKTPSKIFFCFAILHVMMLGVTFFSPISIANRGTAFWNTLCFLGLAMFLEAFSTDILTVLKCALIHLEICTYSNFIAVVAKPDGAFSKANVAYGATKEWVLGAGNTFVYWAIAAILVAYLWIYFYPEKKLRGYLLIAATIGTQFFEGSSTAVVGLALFIICVYFPGIKKFFTPMKALIVAGVIFIAVVVVGNSDFLEPIIVGVLGKDMTFTNRLDIWSNSISAMLQKPIFGNGYLYDFAISGILGRQTNGYLWKGATHCHGQFLQIGFQSGFLGLILYILVFIISSKACAVFWKETWAKYCTFGIFVFAIISISEVFNCSELYFVLLFPYYLSEYITEERFKNYG